MTSEQKKMRLKLIKCVGEIIIPTYEYMDFAWKKLVGDFQLNKTFKSKDVVCDTAHIFRSLYLKTDILNCKQNLDICGENDMINIAKIQIKDISEYSLRDFTLEEKCHFANVYNFVTSEKDMLFSVTEYFWINEINKLYTVVDNLGIFKIDNPDIIDYYAARRQLIKQKTCDFQKMKLI